MTTKVLTAHIPIQLAKKVEKLAEQMDRSRAWAVKQALTDWVELEEQRHRMTLEALAQSKAGRLIDQDVIEAWARSLKTDKPLPRPKA